MRVIQITYIVAGVIIAAIVGGTAAIVHHIWF